MWFSQHYDALACQFDNVYRAWLGLKMFIGKIQSKVIEIVSRKSYVNTNPYLLANKIDVIGQGLTETSAHFRDVVRQEERFVGGVRKSC